MDRVEIEVLEVAVLVEFRNGGGLELMVVYELSDLQSFICKEFLTTQ
jgi:hypothetical protein